MKISTSTILLTTFLSTLVLSSSTGAAESTGSNDVTLKIVMQGLLEDSIKINKGIFLEDFSMIETAADRVANHPAPPMATKRKLMTSLGFEMRKFKASDTIVHDLAVEIGQAAQKENMGAVVVKYHELLDGCLSCHEEFKARVSTILE